MDKLTLCIPTGRLKDETIVLLSKIPSWPSDFNLNSRKLIFEDLSLPWNIILSHPKDSSTYVEFGAADIGIVGKDILQERGNEVYELCDLQIGICQMVVAGPENLSAAELFGKDSLRIATKYPNITRHYLQEKGLNADILYLYGSIELAPIIRLTDAIIDLVSTGKTLRDNKLKIIEELFPVSARLVANRISIKTKMESIFSFVQQLKGVIGNE
ncbi:MAG TPA: ATP phosphoribosyltransferase [Candidatus Atribacteria bacterium]|jgi:ATP phosphoribosyltransferase|uniref:ATP phosphoribosyltransferase n=1 Tax=Atribacter laminatus TaxID=2847778 RepID=A0A7T1AMU5_ATRLM|nr:ATP phosphoribosyltransferase [Atribacter laminatus]QPM68803.1 ATP phosphoribosyltransferase [Atribacter laminatus]HHT10126.1 ATP phosphoribosyltransferase [Candidatus Atribacteria bacterium]